MFPSQPNFQLATLIPMRIYKRANFSNFIALDQRRQNNLALSEKLFLIVSVVAFVDDNNRQFAS